MTNIFYCRKSSNTTGVLERAKYGFQGYESQQNIFHGDFVFRSRERFRDTRAI